MPLANCTSFGMSTTTGPGRPGGGDMERFVDDLRQIVDVLDQPIVLGAGPRDADRVAFLERIGADQRRRNLSGQADQRDRIHQRVLQRRHRVGGARPRRHQHDAGLAGRARIAFGGVAGALLVADQDVLDVVLLENLVIDRKHGAAGIAEQMLDAIVAQRLHDHFGARHFAPSALFDRLVHRSGPVFGRLSAPAQRLVLSRAIKKAPEGACVVAHGRFRPAVTPPCPRAFLLRE